MRLGKVWEFNTARFTVSLHLTRDYGYQYDGDDPDGEVQDKLNTGEYIAFDSVVRVELDGVVIGYDYLGGSVYAPETVSEFWVGHRDPNPKNRNTMVQRAQNRCIGHYFPGMVDGAISEARAHIAAMLPVPKMRA